MDGLALRNGIGFFKRLLGSSADGSRADSRLQTASGSRMLVVDDSPTICAVLGKMLGQDGYAVSKALDGTIMSWNRGAERIFGYRAEEIIGRSVLTLIPSHLQDEETEIIRKLKAGERIDHFESVRRRKDGTLFPVSLTISPIKDREGHIIGAAKIARDIAHQGNTSAASIPLALDGMIDAGEAKSGDTALLIAFGAGLAYAAQVVKVP